MRAALAEGGSVIIARRSWLAGTPVFTAAVAPLPLAAGVAWRTPASASLRGGSFRPEILDHIAVAVDDGHPLADLGQNRRQLFLIGNTADRNGSADLAGPAGAADPVDIGLDRLGQVEIHHQPQARHINAARRHVGGHKNLQLAPLELAENLLADRLSHVAVQHVGIQPLFTKPVGKVLGAQTGARKDKNLSPVKLLKLAKQDVALVRPLDQNGRLGDRIHCLAGLRRLDRHRIFKEGFGKRLHLCRHGGREEHRLAGGRQCFENPFDGGIETEVDHLVALIEDEMFDVVEIHLAAGLKILETARGRHDDVDTLVQRANLEVIALAATDRQIAHLEASRERLDAVGNLIGKLARRGEDQHACAAHILCLALLKKLVEDRQQIGRRLSRARLGKADQVTAREDGRNGVTLDGRRFGQPLRGDVVNDARRKPQLVEGVARKAVSLGGFAGFQGLFGLLGLFALFGLDSSLVSLDSGLSLGRHVCIRLNRKFGVGFLRCGLDGHGHPSRERSMASRDTSAAIDPRLPDQCLC